MHGAGTVSESPCTAGLKEGDAALYISSLRLAVGAALDKFPSSYASTATLVVSQLLGPQVGASINCSSCARCLWSWYALTGACSCLCAHAAAQCDARTHNSNHSNLGVCRRQQLVGWALVRS